MGTDLKQLVELSRFYGCDAEFVLAGGGNTSYKTKDTLFVKASGTTLATISEPGFASLNREKLAALWTRPYAKDEKAREAEVLSDLMAARLPGEESKRPSVETLLHDLFTPAYVVHTHPALVNGLACGQQGKAICEKLFAGVAIWIPTVNPGYVMALATKKAIEDFSAKQGKAPAIAFLENHGLVVAANTPDEIKSLTSQVMEKLRSQVKRMPDLAAAPFDRARAAQVIPAIRTLCQDGPTSVAVFGSNQEFGRLLKDAASFAAVESSYTPDHIVYCGHAPLFVPAASEIEAQYKEIKDSIAAYTARNGNLPKIIAVQGLGVFAVAASKKMADTALALFTDAAKVAAYTESFGGPKFMGKEFIDFIRQWEVESYRKKVSAGSGGGRLMEKSIIVTGGAQGFGRGIAECLAKEGANVVIADLNLDLASSVAKELAAIHGEGKVTALGVNVGDEESVKALTEDATLTYGGIDVFVANAGVAKAGGLEQMDVKTFEFVTRVNYTGYFLCAKYGTRPMKIQHMFDPNYMADIIQISSKSGLVGSKNNFAYAGSKFGGIGLTQSFALELVDSNIKVNSICPGNYLDGPLWSDPEKGLFVQYLNAGKVSGAKTVADVRCHYENQVPMHRGCVPADVARAIVYVVEQRYETGQAIPVAGGQVMLS